MNATSSCPMGVLDRLSSAEQRPAEGSTVDVMSRPGPTARRAASRLLSLLAVLLGLLAMHGLASTHHAVATGVPVHVLAPAHVSDEPTLGHSVTTTHGPDAVNRATVLFTGSLLTGPPGPGCDDDCLRGMAAVCAAVLAAAAAAAVLTQAAGRRPLLPARSRSTSHACVVQRRLLPKLDPVSELCVSRT